MWELLGILATGAALAVAMRARGRGRPAPAPVYNLWDTPKRIPVVRKLRERRWSAADLLGAMAAASARAWPEETKK